MSESISLSYNYVLKQQKWNKLLTFLVWLNSKWIPGFVECRIWSIEGDVLLCLETCYLSELSHFQLTGDCTTLLSPVMSILDQSVCSMCVGTNQKWEQWCHIWTECTTQSKHIPMPHHALTLKCTNSFENRGSNIVNMFHYLGENWKVASNALLHRELLFEAYEYCGTTDILKAWVSHVRQVEHQTIHINPV